MKRFFSFIMSAFIILLSSNYVTKAEVPVTDLVVDSYSVSKDMIYKGVEFDLDIKLKNISGGTLNNIYFVSNSDDFYVKSPSNTIDITDISKTVELTLVCNSNTARTFNFTVYYTKDSTSNTSNLSVPINTYDVSSQNQNDSNDSEPSISIVNSAMPYVKAGEKLDLNFKLGNNSQYTAYDVKVKPILDANGILESNEMVLTRNASKIPPNKQAEFNYSFKVKSDAKSGTYPITIKYSCKDMPETTENIYVKVLPGKVLSELEIDNINVEPQTIVAGEEFNLTFDLKNVQNSFIGDIKVELDGLSSKAFTVNKGTDEKNIDVLFGNVKKQTVSYDMYADSSMADGNYPLTIKLNYINSNNVVINEEKEIYIKVVGDNSKEKADLQIKNIVLPKEELIPGNDFVVTYDLENIGEVAAENIVVSVSEETNNIPKAQKVINNIEVNETKQVSLEIHLPQNITSQNYILNISAECDNNEINTVKQYASIKVGKLSDIAIENISVSEKVISAEDRFTIDFDVNNSGLGTAEDLIVLVEGNESLIPLDENVIDIKELNSGETKHYSIRMEALESVSAQNIPISITVNNSNGTTAVKRFTTVYAEGKSSTKSVPKIIINKFVSTPNIVRAGESFDLDLSFLNTNKAKTVSNIKIYLTVDVESGTNGAGSVFTPVDGSNTFYIDEIQPKQDASISLKMYTIPDAQPKNYTITANMEYEDEDGNQYNSQELIGIQVTQPSKLKIGDINMMSDGFVGQPNPLDIQIYNIGRVSMSNFMVEVQGDFTVQSEDSFIGNVEPGSVGYYYGDLIPNNVGECKGEIVFSYDEPSGEHKEVRKEISMMATEFVQPNYEEMNMNNGMNEFQPPVEEQAGNGKVKLIVILGVIIAALVVGTVVLKRRKKKKEQMKLDE